MLIPEVELRRSSLLIFGICLVTTKHGLQEYSFLPCPQAEARSSGLKPHTASRVHLLGPHIEADLSRAVGGFCGPLLRVSALDTRFEMLSRSGLAPVYRGSRFECCARPAFVGSSVGDDGPFAAGASGVRCSCFDIGVGLWGGLPRAHSCKLTSRATGRLCPVYVASLSSALRPGAVAEVAKRAPLRVRRARCRPAGRASLGGRYGAASAGETPFGARARHTFGLLHLYVPVSPRR